MCNQQKYEDATIAMTIGQKSIPKAVGEREQNIMICRALTMLQSWLCSENQNDEKTFLPQHLRFLFPAHSVQVRHIMTMSQGER